MTPVYKFSTARSLVGPNTYYSSVLAGNSVFDPTPPSAYDWLQTEMLTDTQASVTFSNLNTAYSADYQHLQIRMTGRSTRPDTDSIFDMFFNSDNTLSNYRSHYIRGNGSVVESGDLGNTGRFYGGLVGASISPSTVFGANVIDILDPFETTKNTTSRSLGGSTGFNRIFLQSHLWMNTAAVTTITFDDTFGSFVAGTSFSLYGLKKGA